MTTLEIILGIFLLLSVAGNVVFFIGLRRSDAKSMRYEEYLLSLNEIVANYKQLIDNLFEMNIHFYDDVIFEFVEKTKELKIEINKILEDNADLAEYIYPEQLKPEEPKENLGLIIPPIGRIQ